MQVGGKAGMQTMEAALADLVKRGIVTADEAYHRMPSSEVLQQLAAAAYQRSAAR
jgi:Tfp pilus assembly pilus retraction ATPase PilT